ncbi:hypothetical protein ABW21_db0201712 [Orbilia brochopaga]|nr:hypothetical protein ABW21_db0201712 [Drechslerella brochopaga]
MKSLTILFLATGSLLESATASILHLRQARCHANNCLRDTQTLTNTFTQNATVTVPTTIISNSGFTTTVVSTLGTTGLGKRQDAVTSAMPSYAGAHCADLAAYSSACVCLSGFILPGTVTLDAESTTVTSYTTTNRTVTISPTLNTTSVTATQTFTEALTTTITEPSAIATAFRVPGYLRVKNGTQAGLYVYQGAAIPGPRGLYFVQLTSNIKEALALDFFPSTGEIVVSDSSGGELVIALTTVPRNQSSYPVLIVERALLSLVTNVLGPPQRLTCAVTGAGTDVSCGVLGYPETGWVPIAAGTDPSLFIGKARVDWAQDRGGRVFLEIVART